MPRARTWSEKQLKIAVSNNVSMRSVLTELGLSPTGANYKNIKLHIQKLQLDTGHWLGQAYLRGQNHDWTKKRPLEEILVKNSDYLSSSHLKRRLVKAGLLEEQCSMCGLKNLWCGQPLVLQIDHINGINNDNRIENLRILCPNCHSQTKTFTGRKIKGKPSRVQVASPTCYMCNGPVSDRRYKLCGACYRSNRR